MIESNNIRDRFLISIVDENGIRQFQLHRLVKKMVLCGVVFVLIVAIMIFFTVKILAGELKDMQSQKDTTLEQYANIYIKNENLKQQVKISQEQLDAINQKMLDLEGIINSKDSATSGTNSLDLFDIGSLSVAQKDMMLQLLPNSLPFKEVEYQLFPLKSGIDFEIPKNTKIYATADGIVDLTRNKETKGIGKFVKIVHSFGFTSIYGQLSKVVVKRGDIVRKGQLIGYSGRNGSKDRLHYDIRFLGSKVNVNDFLDWNMENFASVIDDDSVVNWNALLWTFDDMIKINQHQILQESALSLRVK